MAVGNPEAVDLQRRNRLADFLARKYRQIDRKTLLWRLGVEPEECLLNAETPDDEAWRMVRWFEHRDRFAELERAVEEAGVPYTKPIIAEALYASAMTMLAEARAADDARFAVQRREIERLEAHRAEMAAQLAEAQERFVAELAARDRVYAAEIAAFRNAVTDIAATPEGEVALARFNTGDELGALAALDRIRAAHDEARAARTRFESAAEARRIAQLALEARARVKSTTEAVIARFEEVTQLDPGVFWDWIELSRLYEDAGRLPAALTALEGGLRVAKSDRERSVVLNDEGDVLVAQGDLPAARERFQESLDLFRRLAAADKSSASLQRDVSVSLSKLGDVLVAQGDLPAARERFQESLDIRRRLAAADKSSASLQRDVSVSLERLGDVLVAQGDLPAARERFQESLDLARRLAAADKSSASLQRDVVVSMVRLTRFVGSGITWAQILVVIEDMQRRGVLRPADARWLEIARKQAAAEASR